jgi:hypothetical protein
MQPDQPTETGMRVVQLHLLLGRSQYSSKEKMQRTLLVDLYFQLKVSLKKKKKKLFQCIIIHHENDISPIT